MGELARQNSSELHGIVDAVDIDNEMIIVNMLKNLPLSGGCFVLLDFSDKGEGIAAHCAAVMLSGEDEENSLLPISQLSHEEN